MENKLLQFVFWPLSIVYLMIISLRNFLYDCQFFCSYKTTLPVLSVGNLSLGGNGKTPLVSLMARKFSNLGFKPVILTRGYGGSLSGPYLLNGKESALEIGDEPLLLYRETGCPVVVAKKRVAGARLIEQQQLGNLIVLDDGFQHRALSRDFDILSVYVGDLRSQQGWDEGKLLPLGLFREPKNRAFKRAQAIVFQFSQESFDGNWEKIAYYFNLLKASIPANLGGFFAIARVSTFLNYQTKKEFSFDVGKSVIALAGIAKPERFFKALESLNLKVAKQYAFADHHSFSESELEKAFGHRLPVITTAKDATRIPEKYWGQLFVAELELDLPQWEELESSILKKINNQAHGNIKKTVPFEG